MENFEIVMVTKYKMKKCGLNNKGQSWKFLYVQVKDNNYNDAK